MNPMPSTAAAESSHAWPVTPAWYRLLLLPVAAAVAALSGCVLDSPYWAQTFSTTTTAIPIQSWTTDKNHNVKIECSKAYHGGLQPPFGPEEWHLVTDLVPSSNPSYDPAGAAIYSAGTKMTLPAVCWYADGAYSPPKYMTALRATQLTSSGSTTVYRVFDLSGLECLGRENGKAASWFGWLSKSCAMTYSGSSTLLPWVKVIADGPGAAAAASSSSSMARATARVLATPARGPSDEAVAEGLDKLFQSEGVDAQWAPAAQARLRGSYDSASPAGSMLVEAACRSSLCRVEVTHSDEAAQARFVAVLAPRGLFANDGVSGVAVHQAQGKGLRSVYYIAREGKDLSAR